MDIRRWITRDESYEQLRERMVAETSAYITECLQHPELAVHIPMVPASTDRFPPSFSMSFWDPLLID